MRNFKFLKTVDKPRFSVDEVGRKSGEKQLVHKK